MYNQTEGLSAATDPISTSRWKVRLFRAGYLTAIAVATIGWSIGFSWATISLIEWLFL